MLTSIQFEFMSQERIAQLDPVSQCHALQGSTVLCMLYLCPRDHVMLGISAMGVIQYPTQKSALLVTIAQKARLLSSHASLVHIMLMWEGSTLLTVKPVLLAHTVQTTVFRHPMVFVKEAITAQLGLIQ